MPLSGDEEQFVGGYAWFVIDNLTPHLLRALRQAQLYGPLIARNDGLFHPGGNRALCSLHDANEMVSRDGSPSDMASTR